MAKWYKEPKFIIGSIAVPLLIALITWLLTQPSQAVTNSAGSTNTNGSNNHSQTVTNSPNSMNINGDGNVVTQVPKPELKWLGEPKTMKNADGTYTELRDFEMATPYAGSLNVSIVADGIMNAGVGEVKTWTLPDGNVLTSTGGGITHNMVLSDKFYTATVSSPSGKYEIKVQTKKQTKIDVKYNFND